MKKLAIIAVLPLTLTAAMCESAGGYCNRIAMIPVAPAPTDVPETAANNFDTPATVDRVGRHNAVVSKACGVLPVPSDG